MSIPTAQNAASDVRVEDLVDDAVSQAKRWLNASKAFPTDAAAQRLAGVLDDPNGLAFTVGFVDGVMRPEDKKVAAAALKAIVPLTPKFLPWPMRAAVHLGGFAAPIAPWAVVPIARFVLRRMVRHLVIDASEHRLGKSIRRLRAGAPGVRLNINLLGEAILGDAEATRRRAGNLRLLARDDVDYVSVKVSSTVAPHSSWAFDHAVSHAVTALLPLYAQAASTPITKFINLDMEEYKDLDLTIAVFTTILDRPEFHELEAGIVLQAYLPDALSAMMRLQAWAAQRTAKGGAPIKVRVVKGANLPMEMVDAETHGWPLATWGSKRATDASYKAVIDYALRPEHVDSVRIGVAGHNLFDIALAWLLAERRGVTAGIDIEMLLGMATAQAEAVRRDVGSLVLYTPVVHPAEFDVAIAYLVRRLEEGASSQNFMSAVFKLGDDAALFSREEERFRGSVRAIPTSVPSPHRTQDRTAFNEATVPEATARTPFHNTPDTDPSVGVNRDWAEGIRSRMPASALGEHTCHDNTISAAPALEAIVQSAREASIAWREAGAAARAAILHRAGDFLEARRAQLLEVMGSECGKVIEQGDPEISEAIDFAHYYAEQALLLDGIDGATFTPNRLTVVTPPWNFPVAIPAGSTLAALATGSAVIIKPARQARRSGAVMIEALWEAGVPREVLQFVQLSGGALGQQLVSHPSVDSVILTGGFETAQLFRSFRPDLVLQAETSGKNAIIVTPHADLDLAAKDVVASAFGHAGQKCSAASLVVLVGSVASSDRFKRQLIDAARSLQVGAPWNAAAQLGPLIGPAEGKLERALTTLEAGQSWLLRPQKLDAHGAMWSPGIRDGVRAGSEFHLTEYFGPVLGVMTAETLEEAIDIVNTIDYGLTSGLHSLDEAEIELWLRTIEAGNVYVNRGTTGAIVQRQPFGGWKKSVVGTGTKAGGPNYLMGLGTWSDSSATVEAASDALSERVLAAAAPLATEPAELEWLATALASDIAAWHDEFGTVSDVTGLEFEQNVFRYAPAAAIVRFESGSPLALLRTVAAGVRVGAPLTVSSAEVLPSAVARLLAELDVETRTESNEAWARSANALAHSGGRVRLLGATASSLASLTSGAPALSIYGAEAVSSGRVEALAYLREQAVSITAHRFGTSRRYAVPPLVGSR